MIYNISLLLQCACKIEIENIFSSPDPITWRPSSSSVVRRKLFQKSSPLKVQDQWKPNLV